MSKSLTVSSIGGDWSLVWGWDEGRGGLLRGCLVREDDVRLELSWESCGDEGRQVAWLLRRPDVHGTRVVAYLSGDLGPAQAMAEADQTLPRAQLMVAEDDSGGEHG